MKTALLGAALGAAALVAIMAKPQLDGAAVSSTAALTPWREADAVSAPAEGTLLSGQVRETIDVAEYTYLRLSTAEGEAWAAVSRSPVTIGSQITIANATRMEHFQSTTLKRTFEVIHFGNLVSAASGSTPLTDLLPLLPQEGEDEALPPGHPPIGAAPAEQAERDGVTSLPAAPIAAVDVSPATGKNAKTVAALYAEAAKLEGRSLRVRGQVTKATYEVQGKNYFHLRDSSGGPAERRELVIASTAKAGRGDVVTFEGTLRTDVDVGIGYKYAVFLADAKIVEP